MRILYINNIYLDNPNRGTPIRIYQFLKEINKVNKLYISSKSISEDLKNSWIGYPEGDGFSRVKFYKKFIKENEIDIVFTATEINIKIPIILKILTGVKIAIDLHGIFAEELYFAKKINFIKKEFMILLNQFYLLFYDLVFTVSKKSTSYYRLGNKGVHVYGGIDEKLILQNIKPEPTTFTIGYMGNSRAYQGLDELIQALKILKNRNFHFKVNLILSGDIDSVTSILEKENLLDLSRITSDVSHDEAVRLIQDSTILVIPRPSLKMTEYAFPSKLPEFLSTGIPVILTDVGPVRELFGNEKISIIIPNRNIPNHLADAIENVFSCTVEDRTQMGANAKSFVENNLKWDLLGKKINQYFLRI